MDTLPEHSQAAWPEWLKRMESLCLDIPQRFAELRASTDTRLDLLTDRISVLEDKCAAQEKRLSEFGNLGNIITIGTGIGVSILLHVINMVAHSWSGS